MTIEDKMLEFKALNEKTNTWEAPVWRETDTRNDSARSATA
jgi:hypothetical protein